MLHALNISHKWICHIPSMYVYTNARTNAPAHNTFKHAHAVAYISKNA